MKIFRVVGLYLMLMMLGTPFSARADDIDVYSDNSGISSPPNVLLILDNAANFSANAPNCTYVDGTAPSLNGTAGGIEQCAIYNVVSSLPDGAINLGLMVYNSSGIHDFENLNCGGSNGGCLAQPLKLMTGAAKAAFLGWVKTWQTSSSGPGSYWIKASGEATAGVMQEAWAYYAGATGLSGRKYVQPSPGCQKNFVIFIGNAFDSAGTPGDSSTADPIAALAAAPGVTADQQKIINLTTNPLTSYGANGFSCKNNNPYSMGNDHGSKNKGLYADEWARYMYQTDIYGNFDGNQGITTYTVGLLGPSCAADYPALLTSMADEGHGHYFATSSYQEISTAILKILNEVQAVNSVFSSASLPVSVNAQGTYLNQIFLGMFRPDASANPRWLGNLKQYQFILEYPDPAHPDPNQAILRLGDSTGAPAISSAGTGFITPNAISFWTTKNLSVAPDSTGGFYVNNSHGAGGTFDSPDGEMVEKGGAAQWIRQRNLTVNYASTPSSPRNLYTYCPSGSSCNANLTDSSNSFATTNSAITEAMLNPATTVSVSSIAAVKVGSVVIATVTTRTSHGFATGDSITISGANPDAYNGTYTVTVTGATTFTYQMTASTAPVAPIGTIIAQKVGASDRTALINWVRGEDNFGDEMSPGSGYTIRPSVHGDVLHSRPVVVNYGDSRGLVVYYGTNNGVFSAVNGSQTAPIGSVPAGGELWGLVLPEHFAKLNRQRINSPELKLPSTVLPEALPKDYFVDGSPGLYQKLKADGTVDTAYLYLVMRRGGRFIYALDVSDPTQPKMLWKIAATDEFSELGQSWSRPRVTLVKGYANPVLVFGGGYDPAEDAQPPTADTMGRGIFVVDAVTGARVWSAAYTAGSAGCGGTTTKGACAVPAMKWAIPTDITFLDRDNDGKTDRFYAADVGGNVWRVDLEPSGGNTPDNWQVTKLAAVGCASGACAAGTVPRKFFFPPNAVSVGVAGAAGSYDAVMLGSGDREHPLISTDPASSYFVVNRFYVLKDFTTGKDASSAVTLTESSLIDATTVPYNGTLSGFYVTFATGEKAVNASTTTRGTTFFGTNQPKAPSPNSCLSNLGIAKGYALDPFTGTLNATVYDGGGLPPTPITGIVNITLADGSTVQKEFCVGCGGATSIAGDAAKGGDSSSALGAGDLTIKVPKNLRRTYWYKK